MGNDTFGQLTSILEIMPLFFQTTLLITLFAASNNIMLAKCVLKSQICYEKIIDQC